MSERFYLNLPLSAGAVVELDGAEAHHLATVCRLGPGDQVCLFNGDGCEYPAQVQAAQRRHVRLQITGQAAPARELPFGIEVAAPLPRGDRAQFLVEKLTELGVARFVPLTTRRSVLAGSAARRDRLQRYVIEASKQCGRNRLLEVRPEMPWSDYCTTASPQVRKVLAHPASASARLLELLTVAPGQEITLALGPEGGFTDEEVTQAHAAGWRLVGLGPRILRVETAALVVAAGVVVASSGS